MTMMIRIVASMIVCGALAAGCFSGEAAPQPEPASADEQAGQLEQGALAQEREVIYYSEPEKINEVGGCSGPFRCFGPKGLVCWGERTRWQTVTFYDC